MLGDKERSWSNFTAVYPEELHHTAIGDWWEIYTVLSNVSDFFVLKIHYEHPLEVVNGSYLFLYDLNINPYLKSENDISTAYFTVRMETNTIDLHAYTTETDTKWNPINYTTTKEGSTQIITIQMHSEYNKLLCDLVVVFSDANHSSELSSWVIPVLADIVLIALLLYIKRKTVLSALSSRKTSK